MKTWLILGATLAAAAASACCAVTMGLQVVMFAGQTNIIVWDEKTKTEHFIRDASFSTGAEKLGFIAPTPSLPKLEEVDAKIILTLARAVDRYDQAVTDSQLTMGCSGGDEDAASTTPASAVDVLQQTKVAGYEATTVRATDAAALSAWMTKHKFVSTPTIEKWTKFYIAKGWLLTLFKVDAESNNVSTGLVKMSFKTDKPFNPYLVPKDNLPDDTTGNAGLRVFFLSDGHYEPNTDQRFYSQRKLSRVHEDFRDEIATQLKIADLPDRMILTTSEDRSFPNGEAEDDIYFERTGNGPNWPVDQKLIAMIACPLCPITLLGAGWFAWKRLKRK